MKLGETLMLGFISFVSLFLFVYVVFGSVVMTFVFGLVDVDNMCLDFVGVDLGLDLYLNQGLIFYIIGLYVSVT